MTCTYTRRNSGTCSRSTTVTIEDGVIRDVKVSDGCDGNLKAVMALLRGREAKEGIEALRGITCDEKRTSCPDQIAICIEEALAQGGE